MDEKKEKSTFIYMLIHRAKERRPKWGGRYSFNSSARHGEKAKTEGGEYEAKDERGETAACIRNL